MTPAEHREQILDRFTRDFRAKYDKGQAEHNDRLWERADLLDHAIEEAIDLVAYLYTLRDQLRQS